MKIRPVELLESIRSSFWFMPATMTLAAAGAAFGVIHLDDVLKDKLVEKIGVLYAGGAEGARAVLSAIAGSMITVAGVVFSVTIVMLSLASQQFGPRILRSFIRDRSNQLVLGTFVATFVYCLLVLRIVQGTGSTEFVPHISVTLGILLAVISIGVLIFFVHHAAGEIQSSSVITAVGDEIDSVIDRLYPDELGPGPVRPEPEAKDSPAKESLDKGEFIRSETTGYVQYVDADELFQLAVEFDLTIFVRARTGAFVRSGGGLATLHPESRVEATISRRAREAFAVGDNRTSTQDIEFLFRQLTEIAVRALSPGLNDPFTALEALDRLSAGLTRLAGRKIPPEIRRDHEGNARLISKPVSLAPLVRLSLGSIRRYGENHEEVISRLLAGIRDAAPFIRREEDRDALNEEARRTLLTSHQWEDEWARRRIEREAQEALAALSSHHL